MKRIIVLGGGYDQIDLIKDLRSRGYYTILLDYYANPVAKDYAHEHIQVSTLDQEAVLKLAEELDVDGIITACTDQALLTMAYVAGKLNLPCSLTYDKARNITNKSFMKKVMRDNDIPTSRFRIVSEYADTADSDLKYPLMIKPVDCNSSKGVVKVENHEDIRPAILNALQLSRSKGAVIEEYVDGKEVSIDAYVTDDGVKIIMVGELIKVSVNSSTQLIIQNLIPARIRPAAIEKIQWIASRIAKAFEIENSPLLIQAIVAGDNVSVIEFSARLGGGCKHHTIASMTGFDVMKANVDSLLGITPVIPKISRPKKIVSRLHLYLHPGILASIHGTEEIAGLGICKEIVINKPIGAVFTSPKASTDRLGSILYEASSEMDLKDKIAASLKILKIINTEGDDMLYMDLYHRYL